MVVYFSRVPARELTRLQRGTSSVPVYITRGANDKGAAIARSLTSAEFEDLICQGALGRKRNALLRRLLEAEKVVIAGMYEDLQLGPQEGLCVLPDYNFVTALEKGKLSPQRNVPMAVKLLQAEILLWKGKPAAFNTVLECLGEIDPALFALGETFAAAIRALPNDDHKGFAMVKLCNKYIQTCIQHYLKGGLSAPEDVARLASLANAVELERSIEMETQKAVGIGQPRDISFNPEGWHGTFEGVVKTALFLYHGSLPLQGMWLAAGEGGASFYCSSCRDADSNDDNATTDAIQEGIAPIPLGRGITLGFNLRALFDFGAFTSYCRAPGTIELTNHAHPFSVGEFATQGYPTLNALLPKSKREIIEQFHLPRELLSRLSWMDESWLQV